MSAINKMALYFLQTGTKPIEKIAVFCHFSFKLFAARAYAFGILNDMC